MNIPRYIAVFLGLAIGLPILLDLIATFAGINLSSSATAIIPPMIAAMIEGQYFARRHQRTPDRSDKLAFTKVALVFSLVCTAVLVALTYTLSADFRAYFDDPVFLRIAGIIVVAFVPIFAIVAYVFFGLGARNELKRLRKLGKIE
jgi:hypothetical protein